MLANIHIFSFFVCPSQLKSLILHSQKGKIVCHVTEISQKLDAANLDVDGHRGLFSFCPCCLAGSYQTDDVFAHRLSDTFVDFCPTTADLLQGKAA